MIYNNPFLNDKFNKELIEKSINILLNPEKYLGKPTEIDSEGTRVWKNSKGQLHRDNGLPAVIYKNGDKYWYQNGKYHRDNGPAIIYSNRAKFWYQNDRLHREDGPAVISSGGIKEWWLNGKKYSEEEFKDLMKNRIKPLEK